MKNRDNKRSFCDNINIIVLSIYFIGIFIISFIIQHPLYLTSIFLALIFSISITGSLKSLKPYLYMAFFFVSFFILINVLSGGDNGKTIVFTFTRPSFLNGKSISLEAILFSFFMSLKIFIIILTFFLAEMTLDSDRVFHLLSRIFPKTGMTLILTSFMLPKLKDDFIRVKDVMKTRGVSFNRGNIIRRVNSMLPLWKIMLLSSLETSWNTSLAMYSKAFDTGKRSNFYPLCLCFMDLLMMLSVIGLASIIISQAISGRIFYSFYPIIDSISLKGNIFYMFSIFILISFPYLLMLGHKKCNQKY